MDAELKDLRIDRTKRRVDGPAPWAVRLILSGIAIFLVLGAGRFLYDRLNAATEVDIVRVHAPAPTPGGESNIILNATGYIIAAHKIELASKVIGKVAWIGVEKGDRVRQGQVLVRLENDEYRAQVMQAKGNLDNLKAKLAEFLNGSRPEEIAKAKADLEQARADLQNSLVTLNRTKALVKQEVLADQALDDAQARHDSAVARVNSLEKAYELVRIGPRQEQIDALRAQVSQAQGSLDYVQVQLENTEIRAPVDGTVLQRNVEKGEFVTTGFVGDRGAKGYVVSMANLHDLQVELDINQNDFAKLGSRQPGTITTDAYGPSRKYRGFVEEISPEANRQKATVQVKVRVQDPDADLRPEMNASVAFYSPDQAGKRSAVKPMITVPAAAVRDNAVFVLVDGKAVRRAVKVGSTTAEGVQIEDGLIGGEDLAVNPPADLKNGQKIRSKQG